MTGSFPETELVYDPSTGRPVLVAPSRRSRPVHTVRGRDGSDVCPFCPGAEHETPPESDAIRRDESAANQPGWTARSFRNKYPAAQFHEVVAEGPEHVVHPADLPHEHWVDTIMLWRRRIDAFEKEDGVRCAFLFKNVGREAGASVAHNHSQLLGLPILPPRLELELDHQRKDDGLIARDLEKAHAESRLIHGGASHTHLSPVQPKLPYETWVVPHDRTIRFEDSDVDDLARTLSAATTAMAAAFDRAAFNLYLHRVPDEPFHWHFELQPRTGFFAALELGGDMYINSVRSHEAAARFRGEELPS